MARQWRTCDMKLVAFLTYSGFSVTRYCRDGSRAFFEFDDTEDRKSKILEFLNKKTAVEPIAFLDSLNRARDMVTMALKS